MLNPQTAAAYQLQQQNAFIQAVGADKNLKELAIFTEQHNNAQVNNKIALVNTILTQFIRMLTTFFRERLDINVT